MKKRILIFNGVHGSGKSTLAKRLVAGDGRYVYFPEIGAQLRSEVNFDVLHSGYDFDTEIMRRELSRDIDLIESPSIPVVETWHFGNLAYILSRNPNLYKNYKDKTEEQLERFVPEVISIDIGEKTFRDRVTEKVSPADFERLVDFYRGIRENLEKVYADFNIIPLKIMNEGPIEEVLMEMRVRIRDHWGENGEILNNFKIR